MRQTLILIFLTIIKTIAFCQDSAAYKTTKNERKSIFHHNTIKIFSGQKILIKATGKLGKLQDMELLNITQSKINDSQDPSIVVADQSEEKSLSIDLKVVKKIDGSINTIMIVNNPYQGMLTYKAKKYSQMTNNYEEIAVGNLLPGISDGWQAPPARRFRTSRRDVHLTEF